MRVSKDRIDMDDKRLQKPALQDYSEVVVSDNSGTSYTIDLEQGNVFDITLTGDCSFTFANPPASGTAGSLKLILIQDSTGYRSATWPAAVKWTEDNGVPPSIYSAPGSINIFQFLTVDGGSTWYGAITVRAENLPNPGPDHYGYFGGGDDISPVDRIDYSNDTVTATLRGPLSQARNALAATGNSAYGYFGGGGLFLGVSTVDRIDYANDVNTASVRGPLSQARNALAATGTSSFGYFGGGPLSTVDRIDYSNDTATASARGPLSQARTSLAATGNSAFGYFGGGAPGPLSTVDRVDYANDTVITDPRGPLSTTRQGHAGLQNSSL